MKPTLSVVVVVYNIPIQLCQTLTSLSASYQSLPNDFYEVIIVDNGSTPPLQVDDLSTFGFQFRLIRVTPAPSSPAYAINLGLAAARGDIIGVMIDGARILSPGLLRFAVEGVSLRLRTVVYTLGYYLGFDFQSFAMHWGDHDARTEADLLKSIDWPADGYRLFDISTPDESSGGSGLMPLGESNAMFMRASLWKELEGSDERFTEPGGGLVNIDLYKRSLALPEVQPVVLLGEATFHQAHGGTATNADPDGFNEKMSVWRENYERITKRTLVFPSHFPGSPPIYLGSPRATSLTRLSCDHLFTQGIDAVTSVVASKMAAAEDEVPQPLVELIQQTVREGDLRGAVYMARLARRKIAQRTPFLDAVFSFLASSFDPRSAPLESGDPQYQANMYTRAGRLFELAEMPEAAHDSFQRALEAVPEWGAAHLGLSRLKHPGPFYYAWLDIILDCLRPDSVLEIGVFDGESLARYRSPTKVIAIDPVPRATFSLAATTFIFPEESDVFFARLPERRAGLPEGIDYFFIDGLHTFPQVLRDFINCEAYANSDAVCVVHDTIPLNELTQRPERASGFYTGDVWKLVVCLKRLRPDLDLWTLPCAPSGLTLIAGLDRNNDALRTAYSHIIEEFDAIPYEAVRTEQDSALQVRNRSAEDLRRWLHDRSSRAGKPRVTEAEERPPFDVANDEVDRSKPPSGPDDDAGNAAPAVDTTSEEALRYLDQMKRA